MDAVGFGMANAKLANIANKVWNDFLASTQTYPFATNAVASGIIGNTDGTVKHPGTVIFVSSTSANSGYKLNAGAATILLGGKEKTTVIFKTPADLTSITARIGFHDSADHTAPVDGVYVLISGTTLDGRTMNNSAGSNTATTYTVAAGTWYRLVIELNADATLATFTLYADDSDTVLWADTLSTNIPKARTTGYGITATSSGTTAITVLTLDYADIKFDSARRVV
jgi:hypothetical protein